MKQWKPSLQDDGLPRYMALARAIEEDIKTGRIQIGDRLPPQRELAQSLGIHFTTVARGYVEAQSRGLIESKVGQGTFVTARTPQSAASPSFSPRPVDLTMNLPPEPSDPELVERMQAGVDYLSRDIVSILRYQGFGGTDEDKEAAVQWLGRRAMNPPAERVFVTPGAHAAILATLLILCEKGDTVLCDQITYPGIRSIAAQLGLNLVGVPMDGSGIEPNALRDAFKTLQPKALYLNPTLQNPTTITIPLHRRQEVAALAEEFGVPIIEDDAYGFIPARGQQPAPFATIVPQLTWHIAGLSKCLGAGLRLAFVIVPDTRSGWSLASTMRASTVMASPLTAALATKWIVDGTATKLVRFIRAETAERFKIATQILPEGSYRGDPMGFSLWLMLPKLWTRTAFVEHMRSTGIGVVSSDAFVVGGKPPEAVRMCIGGPTSRQQIRSALDYAAHAMDEAPALASTFL